MKRAYLALGIIALSGMGLCAAASEVPWENPVPEGQEKDIIALYRLVGDGQGARDLKALYGEREIEVEFRQFGSPLPLKEKVTLFVVAPAHNFPPVFGEIHLIEDHGHYFTLTKGNLAKLYAPLRDEGEALAYMALYEALFRDQSAVVLTQTGKIGKSDVVTSVERTNEGFDVRLVTYHSGVRAFIEEEDFKVDGGGAVMTVAARRKIEDLGPGK